MEFKHCGIRKLRELLDKRQVSALELTQYFLDRINKHDGKIGSFITICEESAREQANKAQKLIDAGQSGALTGIPLSIKDNICTRGIRTTCASRMLEDFIPPYDATVIKLLYSASSVILGKNNMDEFAMGASTETSYFGPTRNPYDTERVPGGSSGGSSAAVAAGFVPVSIGSDTGGSIRQPAAFCGVTGLRPTYGAVSRYGLVAFASSLDQIGPIARSAEDCGILLNAIAGADRLDATSNKKAVANYCEKVGKSVKGLKVGLPSEFFSQGLDEEVKNSVLEGAKRCEELGCELIEVSLPGLKYAIPTYYLISSAEASSNLARYDGIKFGFRSSDGETYADMMKYTRAQGFGREVKRRILLGSYALSSGYYDAYYKKSSLMRDKIRRDYSEIFEKCDCVLTPTTPTTAFKLGEKADDPVTMYLTDIFTATASIAGLPAISTTCGYDQKGLPIGMSLVGRHFDEATIIGLADAYEKTFTRREVEL